MTISVNQIFSSGFSASSNILTMHVKFGGRQMRSSNLALVTKQHEDVPDQGLFGFGEVHSRTLVKSGYR